MTDPQKQLRRLEKGDEIRFTVASPTIREGEWRGEVVERTDDGVLVDVDSEEYGVEFKSYANPDFPIITKGNTVTQSAVHDIERV